MSTFVTVLLGLQLVTLLFAVIACDEARRLGRRCDDLEVELSDARDEHVKLDKVVVDLMGVVGRRRFAVTQHPSSLRRRLEVVRLAEQQEGGDGA